MLSALSLPLVASMLLSASRLSCAPARGARVRVARLAADWTEQQLASSWERAGKGRSLWRPGTKTDSPATDARLLFTTWKLNPLELHIYDHCPFCMRARLVLGLLKVPRARRSEGNERLGGGG